MKKSDLKNGMVVELANKDLCIVIDNQLIDTDSYVVLDGYSDNLEHYAKDRLDINKVFSVKNGFCLDDVKNKNFRFLKLKWDREEIAVEVSFSAEEWTILRNLQDYKYIARDENGILFLYPNKPRRNSRNGVWFSNENKMDFFNLEIYNHLFKSIQWETEAIEFRKYI